MGTWSSGACPDPAQLAMSHTLNMMIMLSSGSWDSGPRRQSVQEDWPQPGTQHPSWPISTKKSCAGVDLLNIRGGPNISSIFLSWGLGEQFHKSNKNEALSSDNANRMFLRMASHGAGKVPTGNVLQGVVWFNASSKKHVLQTIPRAAVLGGGLWREEGGTESPPLAWMKANYKRA